MSTPSRDAAKDYFIRARLPVAVSAVRYKGDNRQECADFLGDRYGFDAPHVLIRGDEDDRRVEVGEWIVRDASGEFFAATPEGFAFWYGLRIPDGVFDAVDEWLDANAPDGVEVTSDQVARNIAWVQVKMWREGQSR